MQPPNEQRVERRLAAIFAADVAGYSRLMSQDETGTLHALAAAREVMDGLIRDHGGRIANTAGDSVLAEFPSAVDAVQCAVAVQEKLAQANVGDAQDRRLQFRIGVHVGDVVVRGGDLLGGGVNVAARLEGFAEPGGIAISGAAHGYVRNALPLAYTDLGEQQVKNIDEPVRAYAVKHASAPAPGSTTLPKPPLPVPEKPSIAVLPFTNMSDYPEQEYFADGIAEDIITTLSHISSLLVIARNSTFAYKGKARDLRHVGRELGVRYILEGSVRRGGDRIRVTAQLIDASDGSHVWAERYDRLLADVFDIQDELTREIVTALRVALTDGEQARVWQRSTENVSAWADAMRGFDHIWRGNASDNEKAKEFFRSAVRRDPQYSRACAMLARTYYFDLRFGYTTQVDAAQQSLTEYTLRALSLDPQEPYAIAMHAHCLWLSGQFEQGVNAARRATEISPNDAVCRLTFGRACVGAERLVEGEQAIRAAMRLNPLYPVSYLAVLGDALLRQGRLKESLDILTEIVRRNPVYISAHLLLAGVHGATGDVEKAREAVREVLRINPAYTLSMARRFYLSSNDERQERLVSALEAAGLPE